MARLAKKWTAEEDDTLRREVESQPSGSEVRDWCHIAEKLPGRTNKDCRKRWHNTMAGEFRKGLWAKQEDEQLKKAIAKHGTRWTVVASVVKTRSAEQCAKRWQHSLNPDLDRSEWTESEQDQTLVEAVKAVGRQWTHIQRIYFAERSKNAIKNRSVFGQQLPTGLTADAYMREISSYTIVSRKLRRQAQGTQVSEGTAPDRGSNDEDSDDDDDMSEDDVESDKDESGHASSSSPYNRSQGEPSITEMQNVLSDSSWNQFYPMLGGAHPSMHDVAPGSSSNPWAWEPSLSSAALMDTSSDPFPHNNDSTFLDLMMTDSGSRSTSSDTLAYPSTTQLDCSMPWKCPSELEGSCEDLIIPSSAGRSTNTVAVKLTLDNPDSETMQLLMKIAIDKKARFLVERQ
ncbi:uncharacterized protein ATNIH1004_003374 [Aspergillus tanneri]|uniref:Uncharacterized protein n=1 Tax=Aspergillus tanneri TaxID=1220188 RepID=A0A5M9MXJ4_9EURO|nr:uncharacterized protein ATNIH1004_003374 [Aspergillus tanneri]KAA8650686.1 hypothetical protein ATNIH1004_003374 [Aspergillus tanneri]